MTVGPTDPDDRAFGAVLALIMRIGALLGAPVRVTLTEDGSTVLGTLSAYRLAQDGGPGGVYVNLREHPAELRIARIEPVRELRPGGSGTPWQIGN